MHVISRKKLREFWELYPKARTPLDAWYQVAKRAKWENFAEVRRTFNSADVVGRFVVFNIGGNKFRLVTAIHYNRQRIYVLDVLTHAEYSKNAWKDRL